MKAYRFGGDAATQPEAAGQRARFGDWMLTFTGRVYYPMDPRAKDVCIQDIAHSLSMQCRYGGHVRHFYSVAEHSVHMAMLLEAQGRDVDTLLQALLHDATEAYVVDVPRPLKPFLTNYGQIEEANRRAIAEAFGIAVDLPDEVAELDRLMCLREMYDLMPESPLPLGIPGDMPKVALQWLTPRVAENRFLEVFNDLWGRRLHANSKVLFPAAYSTQEKK